MHTQHIFIRPAAIARDRCQFTVNFQTQRPKTRSLSRISNSQLLTGSSLSMASIFQNQEGYHLRQERAT